MKGYVSGDLKRRRLVPSYTGEDLEVMRADVSPLDGSLLILPKGYRKTDWTIEEYDPLGNLLKTITKEDYRCSDIGKVRCL